nr:putative ribonuclease H-like domain-containing protein [Tanacetum cinerariifolium]
QMEPKKSVQALKDPSWVEAMQDELLQFKLLKVSKDKWAIGTKWVYRNKKDERGIMIKNKARLVAQGHTQEECIDYDEVFAPVARFKAIRLFLAYASFKDFVVYQMDVKSAFLYGKIEEKVYVCQPFGFEDPNFPDKVYKVEKALYRLHQSPRAWYETLSTYLLDNASTPVESNKPLIKDEEAGDVDVHLYRSMVGSLMYLTASKPDITFVVCQPKLGLWYRKDSPFDLEAYSDSDYAGASLDRKSTTRGCQFHGNRLISWQCKKQTIVANSTTEAEYVAAANCCGQVLMIAKDGRCFMDTPDVTSGNPLLSTARLTLILMGKVNPTIYVSCVKQFWATAKVKKVNGQEHIQALVDKQKVIITEDSMRSDLRFDDAEEVSNDESEDEDHVPTPSNDPLSSDDKIQGRINDDEIFGVGDLAGEEVVVDTTTGEHKEQIIEDVSTAKPVTTTGEVVTTTTIKDSVAPKTDVTEGRK